MIRKKRLDDFLQSELNAQIKHFYNTIEKSQELLKVTDKIRKLSPFKLKMYRGKHGIAGGLVAAAEESQAAVSLSDGEHTIDTDTEVVLPDMVRERFHHLSICTCVGGN